MGPCFLKIRLGPFFFVHLLPAGLAQLLRAETRFCFRFAGNRFFFNIFTAAVCLVSREGKLAVYRRTPSKLTESAGASCLNQMVIN